MVGARGLGRLGRLDEVVLPAADLAEHRRRASLAAGHEVQLPQDLLHEARLVVGVVDREARVDADRATVAPQDPRTEAVEGAHGDLSAGLLADQADDPLAHLAGGLVGEGHGQDVPGPDALDADEVGDPMGQDAGLAGPGAGQDEERALRRRDRAGLLRVEAGHDLGRERLRIGLRGRRFGGFRRRRRPDVAEPLDVRRLSRARGRGCRAFATPPLAPVPGLVDGRLDPWLGLGDRGREIPIEAVSGRRRGARRRSSGAR